MARGSFTYLKTLFTADTSGLKKGVKDAEKDVEGFSTKVSSGLKGLGAAAAAAFSIGTIVNFGKQAAAAADVELQAQQKLLVALKGREDITQNIIQLAGELQKTTLFGDEDTVNAAAQLAIFVKQEDQLKKLIPVVQDMAQAFGMDLASAAKLVGKSIGSSTNALKRYGIDIEGVAGSTQRAESAISALTAKFEGQAAAAAQVGLGPFKILQNMIGDVVEDIGKWMMPAIQNISKAFIKAFPNGLIDSFRSKIIDLVNWFIELYNESTLVRGSIQLIGSVFNVVWETAKGVLGATLNIFKGLADTIKAVLTGDFKSIPEIVNGTLTSINAKFRKGGEDIVESFEKAWITTFKPREKVNLIDKTKAPQAAYKEGFLIGESFAEGVDAGKKAKRTEDVDYAPVTTGTSAPGSALATGTTPGLAKMDSTIAARIQDVNDQLQAEKDRMASILADVNSTVTSSMQDIAAAFAEGIGNVISGTGNFGDIGKTLLTGVADLAIQLGKIAIGTGIALTGIKKAFESLNPAVAIAAGIALVALGSAVKGAISNAGKGAGSYSGSSGGGGGTYDLRTTTNRASYGKAQPIAVTVSGETTIKNKDIYIAFKNAESSKKMNT